MKKIFFTSIILLLNINFSFSQLRIDNNGNVIVRYGAFSPTNDAILYLGDQNHYIKSKFGYGLSVGTAGSPESIVIPQYSSKVGIYRFPSYCLDVNGPTRATQYLVFSDSIIKTNIEPLSIYAKNIYQLRPVTYKYRKGFSIDSIYRNKKHFGFLAQQLKKVYPELVYSDSKKIMSIDYIGLIPILVAEIQSQNIRINQLQSDITSLKSLASYKSNRPYLIKNTPNPFKTETKISYYIPTKPQSAKIMIFNITGIRQQEIELSQFGKAEITIPVGGLSPGTYVYTLCVNGDIFDSKIMIIIP